MTDKKSNNYDPITNAVRAALENGEDVPALKKRFGRPELGRSLALLTTFEDRETLEALLGKPASDLKILCDVNFSYQMTAAIYENVGIPHFTFGTTFKDQFLLESGGIGNIQPRDSDKDLYAYAIANQYDAILSCDRNLSGPEDLCFIAREHFTGHSAETGKLPVIALLPKGQMKGGAYLEEHGTGIISEIEKAEKPLVDFFKPINSPAESSKPEQYKPGSWLKNYLNQKNDPEP